MSSTLGPSSNNIENIANQAFSFQTLSDGQYAKPDVQKAHVAFEAFQNAPNDLNTLIAFQKATLDCVRYNRTGFQNLSKNLDKIITDAAQVKGFKLSK